jgi:hypothetical protein
MSIDSKKISYLISKQVPEFVRDDYPNFVTFLKAYYEFLENVQGTQKNDLTTQLKDFRYVSDVDESIDKFETHFFETYLNLFPKSVAVDKAFLIKNVLPFYKAKGSENSFKFLFSLLYGEEIEIQYPRDNILRASDGKWEKNTILRVLNEIYSVYDGDGTTTDFPLTKEVTESEIEVYINDVLQNSGFLVNAVAKKLIFNSAPADGSTIKVLYDEFDINSLVNRKIIGSSSGAYAIVEKTGKATLYGRNYYQLFLNNKTLFGTFENNETVTSDLFNTNGNLISIEMADFSDLSVINIIDGGSGYNIGDPVVIGGESVTPAKAVISEVVTGTVDNVSVQYGGAGFKQNLLVSAQGYSNTIFNAYISLVDTSGLVSANTINVYNDLIQPYENVVLNVADYGFPATVVASENVNTVISQALSSLTLTNLGPITQVLPIPPTYLTVQVPLNANSPSVNGTVQLADLGIIGRIDINSGGSGYAIGEKIVFTNQPSVYYGFGANAEVSSVSGGGAITGIKINDGGSGYSQAKLPTLSVTTVSGANANIVVGAIMGDGEHLNALFGTDPVGKILSIRITDSGSGYDYNPPVDLTQSGDGLAVANAVLNTSTVELPGRWTTTDSIISSDDRRLEGRDYYINYSYVIKSKVEFARYKEILKNMIHPSGFVNYGEYMIDVSEIQASNINVSLISVSNTISGTVNTNSTIYVVGTNTKFNVANTLGILVPGSNIAINSQIRTVGSIVSNTVLTVTSAFTINTSGENLVVV